MDYRRIVLLALIMITSVALWHAWEDEHPHINKPVSDRQASLEGDSGFVQSLGPELSRMTQTVTTDEKQPSEPQGSRVQDSRLITITTDVLNLAIDPKGGDFVHAKLLNYAESAKESDNKVTLLQPEGQYKFTAQSGFIGGQGMPSFARNIHYSSEHMGYELADDQDSLVVRLHGKTPAGVELVKQYTFKRGLYSIDVEYQVINHSSKTWAGHFITQLSRRDTPPPTTGFFQMRSFFGASMSTQDKPYRKVSFKEMKKLQASNQRLMDQPTQGGWVAMQQHYFLAAWVPEQKQENYFYYKVYPKQGTYGIGAEGPLLTVEPQTHKTIQSTLYVGPELTDQLKAVAPHLEMTIDYGWLWFISVILFWIMQHIYNVIGNWGWSIVIVTIMIKLAFFQLTAKSHRSMTRLRDLQPKIAALKKRYGDDKQKMTQATMDLYRTEKVNPFGGCLPILVQIPVFIALYWVLIESVELRQAPFVGWIHDLSSKDPYYILPGLFCATMILQQKLTPQAMDPTQAKVMMLLPIIVTALFLNFPAGLLLYMFVNTAMSVLQQWYLSRGMAKMRKDKLAKKSLNHESGA